MKQIKQFTNKVFLWLVNNYIREASIDLELFEKIIATKSSAVYLTEKMTEAKRFFSPEEVMHYALELISKDGHVLEFGVFSGRSINLMANRYPDKTIYGFDSFEGLPEDWRPGFPKKAFDLQGNLPKVSENVVLVKGWFNQTLPIWKDKNLSIIALLHVDCDLYSSTQTIFDELSDQIIDGTIIVFDEYFNYPGWQAGEYKAFQEWLLKTSSSYSYLAVNVKHEQVAVKIHRDITR
jgi:predicted O-methyltransferase YrrM